MRKFKRTAVAAAGLLAFSGIAAGAAQAAGLQTMETQGNYQTDCHTAQTQQELDMAVGHHVTIDHCEADGPGSMVIFYS
ncbi:hypothetical protein [Streptomyces iconiensis]|uniref:Uncharacterized protein n=1 Tax=Streptomyces iconiensis TaxID=1384038 RepID=A0ABT7AAY2_9ACTN|nr:hypothetical protein [Streptomyces iconiensis]MDJ1138511.1 hypothetical protein [Streptomyces iconiensis]